MFDTTFKYTNWLLCKQSEEGAVSSCGKMEDECTELTLLEYLSVGEFRRWTMILRLRT